MVISLLGVLSCGYSIKCLQHQPLGTILTKGVQLLFPEHPEGFGRIVFAHDIRRIEDVAQFIAGESVEFGVVGIEFAFELVAALGIEGEWLALIAEVLGEGFEIVAGVGEFQDAGDDEQACLRPRDRFWDIPVPKIDSAFDNLLVPQPSWSPSTTQQLRKLVAAPYLAPNDWTPRSEAYFVFPLAQGTPGKQCGLAATGVYQPSLRSPWLAAVG